MIDAPSIALRDIGFRYSADRTVFDGLDLELHRGVRLGLVGPNGGGKTTLLHLIVGLMRPQRGTVEVFGETRRDEAGFRDVRRKVGLLFQNSDDQLFCPTVREDVAFGPLNLGCTREETARRVQTALESLDLAGYEERITYRLSQGEKRLVALACVLAMEPRVLLLDEPTAGLDEYHEQRLVEILTALPQDMIVVSHDRQFLDAVATEHRRLRNGRIEPAATPLRD